MKALLDFLGFGTEVVKARSNLKLARINAEADAFKTAAQSAEAWETMAGQNAQNSWLDEIWTAVLLVPLVLAFIGQGAMIEAGFKSLENVPDWYRWAVLASVGWAFARKDVPRLGSWVAKGKNFRG